MLEMSTDPSEITSPQSSSPGDFVKEGDDLHPQRIAKLGDYISNKTRGNPTIESQNSYPVSSEREDYRTTTADGYPTGPTNVSDGDGFLNDINQYQEEAVRYFKNISKGQTFIQDEMPDKQKQQDGHTFLSKEVPGLISSAIKQNRFAKMSFNDGNQFMDLQNPEKASDIYGLDSYSAGADKVLTVNEIDELAKVGRQLSLAASGIALGTELRPGETQPASIASVPQENLRAKNVNLNSAFPASVNRGPKYNDKSKIRMNNYIRTFISRTDLNSQYYSALAYLGIINGAIISMFRAMNLTNLPSPKQISSMHSDQAGYSHPTNLTRGKSRYSADTGINHLDDLRKLGIPIPVNTVMYERSLADNADPITFGEEDVTLLPDSLNATVFQKNPTNYIIRALQTGFMVFWNGLKNSEDKALESGYYLTLTKLLVDEIKSLDLDLSDVSISLGGSRQTNIQNFFKNSRTFSFARVLINLGDAVYGANGTNTRALNDLFVDEIVDSATTRHMKHRDARGKNTLRTRNIPSMFLLPDSILRAGYNIDYQTQTSLQDIRMSQQNLDGNKFAQDYLGGKKLEDDLYETALFNKLGVAGKNTTGNRFSKEQVQYLEDILEAEHMPFYLQDLRTNEIIAFHAFISSLSDSFSPSFTSTQGFGRIEPVQIYNNTSRSVSVTFAMYAYDKEDLDEMYFKVNKLLTLIYPQWSRGTMIESGDDKFVMPFSQVPTATPLVRLRVGDLIKSNYSKQSIARLMGAGDEEFVDTGASGAGPAADNAKEAVKSNIQQNKDSRKALGKRTDKPFDVGSIVNIHCSGRVFGFGATATNASSKFNDYITTAPKSSALMDTTIKGTIEAIDLDKNLAIVKDVNEKLPNPISDTKFLLVPIAWIGGEVLKPKGTQITAEQRTGVSGLFSDQNPIIRSFESTMGRGLAGVISSLGVDWKMGTIPWELSPGYRGPTGVEIAITLNVIHDITPGLDSDGFNRAPIYDIGKTNAAISGDVWGPRSEYDDHLNTVNIEKIQVMQKKQTGGNNE